MSKLISRKQAIKTYVETSGKGASTFGYYRRKLRPDLGAVVEEEAQGKPTFFDAAKVAAFGQAVKG